MSVGQPNSYQNRGNNQVRNQTPEMAKYFGDVKKLIESMNEDYNTLTEKAEQIAKNLKLNSTKLRKFYNHVKKIDIAGKSDTEIERILKRELNKFVAMMVYDVGRESGNNEVLEEFAKGMRNIVESIKKKQGQEIKKSFYLFMDFFESLTAFHKYYEKYQER
ncbi:CRISPR-associated protein Csm2 [Fervidobacterium changbaicum]|uniref:CRISPR system Cms protein Csm2 n=1 Tax=Fervidobacterium changbaicum TaxID=310769 RepID=A0ABX5QRX6_9BACT|nr:type III-A CRISPR-associated protein Csm2 [Fervidobacterium changbaicum]QAV33190.1 type III-A CRISPR-associated protein Csm2 [Fervidobacterium changbaicum]SDH70574.1 CRISPR-associated protein Csm2 [Fervidobacterium changbaicum]